jgi:hypothetical protein
MDLVVMAVVDLVDMVVVLAAADLVDMVVVLAAAADLFVD